MQVFLSYASEDYEKADRLCKYLVTKGVSVWMDRSKLRGGQQWMNVVEQEIRKSTVFLALLSKISVQKTGVVQREFKLAISHQRNKPSDRTFIIPVRLDDCKLPVEFEHIHCVDLKTADDFELLHMSVEQAFEVESKYGGGSVTVNSLQYSLYAATIDPPAINIEKKNFVYQAPFPGVFYRGRSPKEGPYRREGEAFRAGDPLIIIECCKNFFEFTAEEDGVVGAFLTENGGVVHKGSPVFLFYYEKNLKKGSW